MVSGVVSSVAAARYRARDPPAAPSDAQRLHHWLVQLKDLGKLLLRRRGPEELQLARMNTGTVRHGWGKAQEAPRVIRSENHPFVERGCWKIKRLRRLQVVEFFPWTHPEEASISAPKPPRVNRRDPLALARHYQALLDSGVVETRAQLARYLGVSRARVTQVLRRLSGTAENGASLPSKDPDG